MASDQRTDPETTRHPLVKVPVAIPDGYKPLTNEPCIIDRGTYYLFNGEVLFAGGRDPAGVLGIPLEKL